MRTANPALNAKTFTGLGVRDESRMMTIQGTVHKTGFLLLLVLIGAWWTWKMFFAAQNPAVVYPWIIGGAIGGLEKEWAGVTAPLYAILEGFMLGGISSIFEAMYPGIVIQAVGLTFGTLFGLLIAYRSGLIKVTENFKLGVVAATGGIFMVYMASWILGIFGINMPFILASSSWSLPRLTSSWTSTSSSTAQKAGRPSSWSGTLRSALWSRSYGFTSRYCGYLQSFAEEDSPIG
jgi:uncharacterized YccA/Bax inhibitor family protein